MQPAGGPDIPEIERTMLLLALDEMIGGEVGDGVKDLINHYLDTANQGRSTDLASYQAAVRMLNAAKTFRQTRLSRQAPEGAQIMYRVTIGRPRPGAPTGISDRRQSVVWRHPQKPDVTWKWVLDQDQAEHPHGSPPGVDVFCQRFTGQAYDGGLMQHVTGPIAEIFSGAALHSFGLGLEARWEQGRPLITLLDEGGKPVTSPAP
jgi:hypothetical protein